MHDWIRSLTALGAAFAGVVVITLGLAVLIVPDPAESSQSTDGDDPDATTPVAVDPRGGEGIPGLGGTLAVTGDREGTFRLREQHVGERYSLEGENGRITFEGSPVEVVQISYDGLEFFPDPGSCTITPGDLDNAIGIGFAELVCEDLTDIRDNGVIGLAGQIALPVDMLTPRTLPPSGGSLAVGGETWEFEEALLFTWQMPAIAGVSEYNLRLLERGVQESRALNFTYDIETHALALANVQVGNPDNDSDVPAGACSFDREELGRQNPQTAVVELTIDCPEVEVPDLGPVPIRGTIIVDEIQSPS